jgi:hypothetical protein
MAGATRPISSIQSPRVSKKSVISAIRVVPKDQQSPEEDVDTSHATLILTSPCVQLMRRGSDVSSRP